MAADGWALDDAVRLAALAETGLLDSPADETFDRFTRLVTMTLGVPTSLVSLVDDRRQFFKSALGLGDPWASAREMPLSYSLCQYVVRDDAPLVLNDARGRDPYAGNDGVTRNGTVAYAGFPLRTPEGVPLGALCAADVEPRSWTPQQLAILEDLAQAVGAEIGMRLFAVRQRAFAANASHQLRTPLTALRLELEEFGLVHGGPDVDPAVATFIGEVDRLSDTVTSLLEMAREGRFSHEREVDLVALVGGVVRRFAPLARQRDRQVVVGRAEPATVVVAEAGLTQIVEVLVDNALDHGAGTVTVELLAGDDQLRILVADEGAGLDPQAAARIFERAERGDGSEGEGIGLSLADEIARRLGGRLVLLPGAPTTFELLLPRR